MQNNKIEKLDTPDHSAAGVSKSGGKRKIKGKNRISRWFREMRSELKKVVWPTPKQTVNHTIVALTVMAIAAVAIWALDFASGEIFKAIVGIIPSLIKG
ncbi:MAG: preprotein translocase subunit SecE [Oscillospiraceae bacterium]|nr:preprotein translocase subunit SecE [Oscillospiraceae bacterium]